MFILGRVYVLQVTSWQIDPEQTFQRAPRLGSMKSAPQGTGRGRGHCGEAGESEGPRFAETESNKPAGGFVLLGFASGV